ncbi:hypothetical protein ACQEXU_21330 [Vibrio sp. TRT 21S02]|uniref:hypothetical protein n=1 Tax=Vibrio sp. TRT 21S02 TaxID=3418507 RepID=UPI003CFAFB63
MKLIRSLLILSVGGYLSGCSIILGEPSERVSGFTDFELCTELADNTFKYRPEWVWALSDEIKKRELDSSEWCENTYKSRMERHLRKIKATPIPFADALYNMK